MSIKTTKRVALGVVSALVFAPIVAITPASAAAGPTILTTSSVSGTIVGAANGSNATGTVTLNLLEPTGAAGWDTSGGDITIEARLVTRYSATGQCWFNANSDGTATGAVVSGYSDELFASAANEPGVEADETAKTLTVTLYEGTTDNAERESVTVSGLTVQCSTTATVGKVYVEITTGNVAPAGVSATYTTGEALPQAVPDGYRFDLSNSATTSNFPFGAVSGNTVYINSAAIAVDGPVSMSASAHAGTDLITSAGHGLTTGDKIYLDQTPAGIINGTAYAKNALRNSAMYVRYNNANSFYLHSTKAGAIAASGTTLLDITTDLAALTVNAAFVDANIGTIANATATDATDVITSEAHGLSTGAGLVVTDRDDLLDSAGIAVPNGTTFYVIRVDADSFRLAATYADALNGGSLAIGSSAGGTSIVDFAKTVVFPAGSVASGATVTLYPLGTLGVSTSGSDRYLGTVGSVSATFNTYVAETRLVTSVASKVTVAGGEAGVLTVATNSSGAIADSSATTITVTLTGGKFEIAPTINATSGTCTLTADLVYPRDSITVGSADGSCTGFTMVGKYDISGLTPGGSLSAAVTVANGTNPVSYTSALQTRNMITFAAATGAPATPVSMASGDENAAGAVVTVTESNAGAFKTGHWVAICFADAAGNDVFNTDTKQVWATVTAGDLKLAGNVTTLRATLTDDVGVNAYDDATNQCAQVRVYSASTTASKITFSAGTPTAAEATVPFRMDTGTANGVIRMGVIAGDSAAVGQLYSAFVLGTRSASNNFTVSAGAATSFQLPASGASVADVTVTEKAKGMFGVGTITLQLSNSLGVDNNISVFAATSGANAPVVTQTASSDISWTYTVIADRVTITIASPSTDAAASFKISNIKLNVADKNVSGLAVTDNDLFAVVAGAAVSSNSYYLKMATVAPADVVVDPVAPELSVTKNNGRIFLTGLCQADEGDIIVYVKTPGKAWNEMAKTLECFAGAFDGDRLAPKASKLYRVKQEGTGLFSNQVLVRP